jgi:hypothetical protein
MFRTDSEHYWTLLKILNKFWTFWTWTEHVLNRLWALLNITENSEHYWKFWTDSEHSEHGLNRFWTLLNILSIDWTYSEHYWTLLKILNRFWTWTEQNLNITEHSEHRLNMYWTDSEHYWTLLKILNRFWTFWTWTEQILNITEHYWKFWTDSFLIKCFIFYIKSIYFTSLALDFN